MYITSDRVNSAVNGVGRGQMDTDNPAEYGFIKKWIVPLGLKRLVIGTIRYPFKTLPLSPMGGGASEAPP